MANNKYTGKKIKPIPNIQSDNIGVDTNNEFIKDLLNSALTNSRDIATIENFSTVSQTRESIYSTIDTMSQDSTVASILETYAEDICEFNDYGKIVWAESADSEILKTVNYLIDKMQIDKHIYGWVFSLVKYGDLYLRLYRTSDSPQKQYDFKNKTPLNEGVKIKIEAKDDRYTYYVEKVDNPSEMFELTRMGKTAGFIKAPVNSTNTTLVNDVIQNQYTFFKYGIKDKDVEVYPATSFVHAYLEDNTSRTPEEVQLYDDDTTKTTYTYKVRRGQSLMYNTFKVWRQLTLLENSILLSRLTKSSIVRIISIEVGDMSKDQIANQLSRTKSLIEQKSAVDTGNSLQEYTNPGPIENNIYVPTKNGIGAISTSQIGGDVDPKQLTDLEYFRDKFFSAWRVPKQYFGFTDDGAGFNGGASLSILSSRYGKSIKRIQNQIVQMLNDLINLMLKDMGCDGFINKFTIHLNAPITQEELDKRDAKSTQLRNIQDAYGLIASELKNESRKLKLLKCLVAPVIDNSEVMELLDEEINELSEERNDIEDNSNNELNNELPRHRLEEPDREENNTSTFEQEVFGNETEEPEPFEENELDLSDEENDYLPSPNQLGIDMTNND